MPLPLNHPAYHLPALKERPINFSFLMPSPLPGRRHTRSNSLSDIGRTRAVMLRDSMLADIERDVESFIAHYTSQVNNKLMAYRLTPITPVNPITGPQSLAVQGQFAQTTPILDQILPPPPAEAKTRSKLDLISESSNENSDNDIDTTVNGQAIKKRCSKLPLKAVLILRQWLSDHVQFPYPTESEREALAKATGMSMKQVQNWFTNTRKRFWSPWVARQKSMQGVTAAGESAASSHASPTPANVSFVGFSLEGS